MIVAQESEQLPFSDEDIVANVFTLLLAGEDTTANTLAWAMKLFIDHPAAFAAVRAEVDAALGAATLEGGDVFLSEAFDAVAGGDVAPARAPERQRVDQRFAQDHFPGAL